MRPSGGKIERPRPVKAGARLDGIGYAAGGQLTPTKAPALGFSVRGFWRSRYWGFT